MFFHFLIVVGQHRNNKNGDSQEFLLPFFRLFVFQVVEPADVPLQEAAGIPERVDGVIFVGPRPRTSSWNSCKNDTFFSISSIFFSVQKERIPEGFRFAFRISPAFPPFPLLDVSRARVCFLLDSFFLNGTASYRAAQQQLFLIDVRFVLLAQIKEEGLALCHRRNQLAQFGRLKACRR